MSTHGLLPGSLIYPSGSNLQCNVLQGFLSRIALSVDTVCF